MQQLATISEKAIFIKTASRRLLISAFIVFWLTLLCGLLWTKSFDSEYGAHPDEAAHYVTGLMVSDYLWGGEWESPMAFAQRFYDHYPKVALGNWPPGFYLMQAAWHLPFGYGRVSMLVFMSVFSVAVGLLIFRVLRPHLRSPLAWAGALAWLLLPLTINLTGSIMSEAPISLLSFLAALAFSRYVDAPNLRHALYFGLLASFAILVKGSAAALALMPLITLALTGKWRLLKKPSFWLPVLIVLALCGPWTYSFGDTARAGWTESQLSLKYFKAAILFYPCELFLQSGWPLGLLALAGLATHVFSFRRTPTIFAVSLGLCMSILIFQTMVPNGLEARFLLPASPHFVMLSFIGLASIMRRLPSSIPSFPGFMPLVFLCLILLTLPLWMQLSQKGYRGFGPVAEKIQQISTKVPVSVLVSSDSQGEGMFIAEIAQRDHRPFHSVRRSSKALSTSSWGGTGYHLTYSTTNEIEEFLSKEPIHFIVLDSTVPDYLRTPDIDLLSNAMSQFSQQYELVGIFPCTRKGLLFPKGLFLYKRRT